MSDDVFKLNQALQRVEAERDEARAQNERYRKSIAITDANFRNLQEDRDQLRDENKLRRIEADELRFDLAESRAANEVQAAEIARLKATINCERDAKAGMREALNRDLAAERRAKADTEHRANAEIERAGLLQNRVQEACEAFAAVFNEACQARDAAERKIEELLKLGEQAFDALYEWMTTEPVVVPDAVLMPLAELKELSNPPPPQPADLSRDGSRWPEEFVAAKKDGE